jgi:hypothetical protein
MYKKMLMLVVASLLVLCSVQPAMAAQSPLKAGAQGLVPAKALAVAAWQPLNQTLGDLRLQRTKNVIIGGIDGAINVLKASENGVERSKLTDGQKAELKVQIESNITWFETKKQDVQSSRDVATALQNAKQASERWNEVYPGFKKEIGLMACDNFDAKLNKAKNVTAIASSKIDSLRAQGKDTGGLEKALEDYNGHVDGASQYVANARSEFTGIGASNDGHFAAGIKQLGLAEGELKNAYSDLKTIYRLFLGNSVKTT